MGTNSPTELPTIDTRVVIRYRLGPGSSHPLTDVIGFILAADHTQLTVRTRHGKEVSVAIADVVAIKTLPPEPTRNKPRT
ncbi:MAG: GNAT family acetyltransferase [Mycobacteriaceae bacterium]